MDNQRNPTLGLVKFAGNNHGYIKGILEESIFVAATIEGDLYYFSNIPLEKYQLVSLQKITHFKGKKLPTVKQLTPIIPVIIHPKSSPNVQLFLNGQWYDGIWETETNFPANIRLALVTMYIKYGVLKITTCQVEHIRVPNLFTVTKSLLNNKQQDRLSLIVVQSLLNTLKDKTLKDLQKGILSIAKNNISQFFELVQKLFSALVSHSDTHFYNNFKEINSPFFELISSIYHQDIDSAVEVFNNHPHFFFLLNNDYRKKIVQQVKKDEEGISAFLNSVWNWVCQQPSEEIRAYHHELFSHFPQANFAIYTEKKEETVFLLNLQLTADRLLNNMDLKIGQQLYQKALVSVNSEGEAYLPDVPDNPILGLDLPPFCKKFMVASIYSLTNADRVIQRISHFDSIHSIINQYFDFENIAELKENLTFQTAYFEYLLDEISKNTHAIDQLTQVLKFQNGLAINDLISHPIHDKIQKQKQQILSQLSLVQVKENGLLEKLEDVEIAFLIKNEIATFPTLFFDIESDGRQINEWAFLGQDFQFVKTYWNNNAEQLTRDIEKLNQIFQQKSPILIGQNILEFDLPILQRHNLELTEMETWDTLLIEAILNPMASSLALETTHHALEDTQKVKALFIDQCLRLLYFQDLERFKSITSSTIIDSLIYIKAHLPKNFALPDSSFLVQKTQPTFIKQLEEKLEKTDCSLVLIAPAQVHQNLLAANLTISFPNTFNQWIDFGKSATIFELNSLETLALQQFAKTCSERQISPIFERLTPWLRRRIQSKVTDLEAISLPAFTDIQKHSCWLPYDFFYRSDALPDDGEIIVLYPNIIQQESKYFFGEIEKSDFENYAFQQNWWTNISGGRSYFPLEKTIAQSLISNQAIPDFFDNFWIAKTAFDQYQLYGNCSDYFNTLQTTYPDITLLCPSKNVLAKGYYISVKSSGYHVPRLNADSRYRDAYWLMQSQILENLTDFTSPLILFVENEQEMGRLRDYLRFKGVYIPAERAALHRQLELLKLSKKRAALLVVSFENFADVLENCQNQKLTLVIEALPVSEQWAANRQHLQPLDPQEIDKDNHINSEKKQSHGYNPIEATRFLKPYLDYLRTLAADFHPQHQLYFLDARLEGLGTLMNIRTKSVTITFEEEVYDKQLANIRQFIPPAEVFMDKSSIFDATKSIEKVFLPSGKTVYEYQQEYLNHILPAQKNMVVSIPTGGGKSLLFQGPALYKSSRTYRLNLVITPLKALMRDQVEGLWKKGFWGSVEAISGDLEYLEIKEIYRRVAGGEILLLFITPERFRSRPFIQTLMTRLKFDRGLEYVVFDEAHCVSQWGNEFRPDYRNAARYLSHLQNQNSFTLLMLSATISEQVFTDLNALFPNLYRLEEQKVYNPIRQHIRVGFELSEPDERLQLIAQTLSTNFDQTKSKALVFINSRKKCEELADNFNTLVNENAKMGRSAFFHAGMSYEDRSTTYQQFKDGIISTLFATKAFGMGMDIPNIHYVFHFKPSSTFEDFLQEIGRAGRNKEDLNKAGFSDVNPLKTYCYYNERDFRKMKEFLLENNLSWGQLSIIFEFLIAYFDKIALQKEESSPVPFDLLLKSPLSKDKINEVQKLAHLFRLSLYWLEKLNRIKLGYYAPSVIYFSANFHPQPSGHDATLKKISAFLQSKKQAEATAETLVILIPDLQKMIEQSGFKAIFKVLLKGHRERYFQLDWKHRLIAVKNERLGRAREIEFLNHHHWATSANLEAAMELALTIIREVPKSKHKEFDIDEITQLVQEELQHFYQNENDNWKWAEAKTIKRNYDNFLKQRVKHVFKLLAKFEDIKYRSILKDGQVFQYILNVNLKYETVQTYLQTFKKDCYQLLRLVATADGTKDFPVEILFQTIKSDDVEYLENLLIFLKNMGYLRIPNSLIPTGIEVTRLSDEKINEKDPNSHDFAIHQEFLENAKLRELRLLVLQSAALLYQQYPQDNREIDKFIKQYFACKDVGDIINLLDEFIGQFPKGQELLKIVKEEALIEKEEQLNPSQRTVYDFSIQQNLNVIAGPGSGKTHTLVLRIARMIHREAVAPDSILVLAYNRAVVAELKNRLGTLMHQLGYELLAKRIRIFTFHGFMKYCLQERLAEVDFGEWTSTFLHTFKYEPNFIKPKLEDIQYVLIDEFQDITPDRLAVLQIIAPPEKVKLTVIGDPNQSIYGYERVEQGGNIHPRAYYQLFSKKYQPAYQILDVNYRSFSKITALANPLIADDNKLILTRNFRQAEDWMEEKYSQILDGTQHKWLDVLAKLLKERNSKNERYTQIAVMFRSNQEVFRAYSRIPSTVHLPIDTQLTIQSGAIDFMRVQEVHHFFTIIENRFGQQARNLLSSLLEKCHQFYQQKNWNTHYVHLLDALHLEFMKTAELELTLGDFHQFVQEVTRRDDGQLSKIFQLHLPQLQEKYTDLQQYQIILTTIHKVKGLEYDAVLIPPSFADFPFLPNETALANGTVTLQDYAKEECRLYYVALTRAKDRLIWLRTKRANQFLKNQPYSLSENHRSRLGYPIKEGIEKFYISYGAKQPPSFDKYIQQEVKIGNSIFLKKDAYEKWLVMHEDYCIGILKAQFLKNIPQEIQVIKGLIVVCLHRYTWQDCLNYDEKHETRFQKNWNQESRKRGFVTLADFTGFGMV